MTRPSEDFDDPIRTVGADATAAFDNGLSNPTEHAGSEALAMPEAEENQDSVAGSDDEVEPAGLEDEAEGDDEDEDLDDEETLEDEPV